MQANMKKMLPWMLLLTAATAAADWLKVQGQLHDSFDQFIELKTVRQTGPMNTMRRVWEVRNFNVVKADGVVSVKSQVEYDCKDRRFRVLEEGFFSDHWAKGDKLATRVNDVQPGAWSGIGKRSLRENIFNTVCPSDESDASTD